MNALTSRGRHHLQDIISSWTRERPDLDLSNYIFAMFVMRLGRVVDDVYDRLCRKRFGISGADMRVLFALRRAGKPYARRPTDLFRALLVTSGAITKQVDRLSRLGFVERFDDPTNSAGVLIALTGKGLKAANAATDHLASNSPIAPALANLSPAERGTARRLVHQMLQDLEEAIDGQRASRGRTKSSPRRRRRLARA
jgi:DNA-binding MarR family transcriptional regulator